MIGEAGGSGLLSAQKESIVTSSNLHESCDSTLMETGGSVHIPNLGELTVYLPTPLTFPVEPVSAPAP